MLFLGELAALLTSFLWSNSSFIFTAASMRIGSIQLNVDRMLVSLLYLILTIIIFHINLGLNYNQVLLLSLSGLIGLIIGDTALFKSFAEIGPFYSMLLYSTNPGIAAVFSFLILGETLGIFTIIGITITILGIFVVSLDKKNANKKFRLTTRGIILGIIAALGQGIGLIFAKMAFNYGDLNSFVATFVRIGAAFIVMLILAIILRRYHNPVKLYRRDIKSLKLVALGSFIGPYIGITLSFIALENTSVGIAATLMSTSPIMIIPISRIVYKEQTSFSSILGACIAVLGIAILFLF
ncbi:MAG TPA: DMT family transporter [Candidatus Kapabacteria bacterium]|nr:DMT family transporter [Candidatus Kapabacteria bacterium]